MIPQRNISRLVARLSPLGTHHIPESVIERDYCLAWFLIGMAQSKIRNKLAFKGGTALRRCYFADYRFSEDLDFTLTEDMDFQQIRDQLEDVFEIIKNQSAVVFSFIREDRVSHLNSYTFFLGYDGPLPGSGKQVKVDITRTEKIVFPLNDCAVLKGYDEYSDLPENKTVLTYSIEEIATEKLVAMADRARNEPRDLFDIWHLAKNGLLDVPTLLPAIKEKLAFRGKTEAGFSAAIKTKEAKYRKLWEIRLASQVADLPEFDHVWRSVGKILRQIN